MVRDSIYCKFSLKPERKSNELPFGEFTLNVAEVLRAGSPSGMNLRI